MPTLFNFRSSRKLSRALKQLYPKLRIPTLDSEFNLTWDISTFTVYKKSLTKHTSMLLTVIPKDRANTLIIACLNNALDNDNHNNHVIDAIIDYSIKTQKSFESIIHGWFNHIDIPNIDLPDYTTKTLLEAILGVELQQYREVDYSFYAYLTNY